MDYGAKRAVGIDLSEKMVEMAKAPSDYIVIEN